MNTEDRDLPATPNVGADEFPTDLIAELEALKGLDDEALWRLAREAMSRSASEELEDLHFKQRDEGLSPDEDAARARLLYEYERVMLIRAQATVLLKERGHEVSGILAVQ